MALMVLMALMLAVGPWRTALFSAINLQIYTCDAVRVRRLPQAKHKTQRVSTLAAGRAMCSCPRGRGWSASTIAPLASTQSHPAFAHEPASKATL